MEVVKAIEKDAGDDEHTTLLKRKCQAAIGRLRRAIALYRDSIALSFNGGKDSTIILHLLRAALALEGNDIKFRDLCVFFFPQENDFSEITAFVAKTAERYELDVLRFNTSFKGGLETLVKENGVKAIVLGTRESDPNAVGQGFFCPSSEGWPPFMRVNPILDWSYRDVWDFMQLIGVEYCSLYDLGYTSIGNMKDTEPNINLLEKEGGTYSPAYKLQDGTYERAGRVKS